ncbi:hypothetical protein LCGC14_1057980 [marine sediment metagenome]|uniref:Uncharacterized protein n=1 Tax=marine sediment metagenome TaxID=412755 RepID=A0A0F9MRM6_9ZZZZ
MLITSCQDNKPQLVSSNSSTYEIATGEWPKKLDINAKAQDILNEWDEYMAFETSFDALYNVANRDDLELTVEDLIEKQNTLETSEYPETFNKEQIKSRQKVFKTYILKVKGDIYYRTDPKKSVVEMIKAYNAFRDQFNVTVNNTFNTDLILEE